MSNDSLVSVPIGTPLYNYDYGAKVDERDRIIAEERIKTRLALPAEEPLVGDVVLIGGKLRRIAHVRDDSIQWADGGSFYLGEYGGASMSGGLECGIPREQFSPGNGTMLARFWIFHHGRAAAHAGVDFMGLTRVWKHNLPNGETPPTSMAEREAIRNSKRT